MTSYQIATVIVSAVGLLAVSGSLVYSARQARALAQGQFQTSFIAVSNAFLAHPNLRPLFYVAGTAPPDPTSYDHQNAETIAELLLDIFDLVLELEKRFKAKELANGWRPYMTEMLATSEFLREFLRSRVAWYERLRPFLV